MNDHSSELSPLEKLFLGQAAEIGYVRAEIILRKARQSVSQAGLELRNSMKNVGFARNYSSPDSLRNLIGKDLTRENLNNFVRTFPATVIHNGHCQALTTRGNKCPFHAVVGQAFCKTHLDSARKSNSGNPKGTTEPGRCQALTSKGNNCPFKAVPGRPFCNTHLKQHSSSKKPGEKNYPTDVKPAERCEAVMDKNGKRCPFRREDESKYCHRHRKHAKTPNNAKAMA